MTVFHRAAGFPAAGAALPSRIKSVKKVVDIRAELCYYIPCSPVGGLQKWGYSSAGSPSKPVTHPSQNLIFRLLTIWGYSSAGRALEWHSRGQRFDPAYLHHQSRRLKWRPVLFGERVVCHVQALFTASSFLLRSNPNWNWSKSMLKSMCTR